MLANVFAGLVVGIIALPLSLALAIAVGVSPVHGLYTAAFAGAVASIAGGSRFNITGPTAALVPLLQGVVLSYGPEALPLVGLMAGLILLAMSALRLGRLIAYVPGVVVVGFTAGIALSIAFGQVSMLLALEGTDPSLRHFTERLWDVLTHLHTAGPTTSLIALGALVALVFWQRRHWRFPGTLVVIAVVAVSVWAFHLDTPTLASRYGELPKGLPSPTLGFIDLRLALDLLPSAIAVALLAGVESLLSAVVADGLAPAGPRHKPDRELFGQGLANLVSPILGGIPATAAIARTGAGIRNGATSRITGVVHAVVVLSATLVLGGLAGHIPLTVLAVILVITAWNIADVPQVVRLARSSNREDAVLLVSTILVTLLFDLSYAIALGVLISMVSLVRNLGRVPPASELLPNAQGQIQQVSTQLSAVMRARPDIAFFNACSVISFHCATQLEECLSREPRPLVLRMKDLAHIDASGMLALEHVIRNRSALNRRLMLTAVRPEVMTALTRFGIIDLLGSENVYPGTIDAIAAVPEPLPPGRPSRASLAKVTRPAPGLAQHLRV